MNIPNILYKFILFLFLKTSPYIRINITTMNFIKGYKPVPYKELKKELEKTFEESGKSMIELATAAGVTTTNSIYTAINSDPQVVSDKVLTSVFQSLGLGAFVMWINGEKHYFLKNKQAS